MVAEKLRDVAVAAALEAGFRTTAGTEISD